LNKGVAAHRGGGVCVAMIMLGKPGDRGQTHFRETVCVGKLASEAVRWSEMMNAATLN
jgi:hypothetical protein